MDFVLNVLAFQQGQGSLQGIFVQLTPFFLIFVIFYFLLIAPQRKRQKELQEMVENLKRGDKVITHGGIHGEVSSTDSTTAILKISDNVKIKVSKSAIAGLETIPEKGDGK